MNTVDTILLVLLVLFGLRGYFKGLFRETFSLLGLAAGFAVGARYDEVVAGLWPGSPRLPFFVLTAASFLLLFAGCYAGLSAVGWALHRLAPLLWLRPADRVGGLLLGTTKGLLVAAVLVFLLSSAPFTSASMARNLERSYLASSLYRWAEILLSTVGEGGEAAGASPARVAGA